MRNNTEISNELLVQRIGQGIKLKTLVKDTNPYSLPTVADILDAPLNFWFSDTDYACVKTSEDCADVCGMDSAHASIGKTAFDFLEKEQAIIATNNDTEVMESKRLEIIEFDLNRIDGFYYQSLTFKFPWYNQENKIIGTFGCGIILGRHKLAEALAKLISLGLLSQNQDIVTKNHFLSNNEKEFPYFSQRELQCLRQTIRGKSAKQVGNELGISRRTVEEYLNNIKVKLGVSSKAELIDKAIDYFYRTDNE